LNANTLYQLQKNVIIAALRRPTLGSTIKGAGVCEQHFPIELRPAFEIAMTKSQQEIRHLVTLRDPRIWPLYGQRIIEALNTGCIDGFTVTECRCSRRYRRECWLELSRSRRDLRQVQSADHVPAVK
jgi:hypothetical protein